MSKEITKAFILQQMEDKFGLRELVPERFTFAENVVPVYEIEQHLEKTIVDYTDVSITSGPAGYLFFSIPENQKWKLRGYNVIFMAAGAYKVTGLYIRRQLYDRLIYLDMTLGRTVSYSVNLPSPVVLEPGNKIYVYVDDYISTADLRLYIDYTMEEIR